MLPFCREKNEADTRKRVNEAVHLLCMGTDDFTTDKRGDIGRFVSEILFMFSNTYTYFYSHIFLCLFFIPRIRIFDK